MPRSRDAAGARLAPRRRRVGAHATGGGRSHRPDRRPARARMPRALTVMLGALCHDLGKPATTSYAEGRIRSLDHEDAGVAPTPTRARPLNVHTLRRLRRARSGDRAGGRSPEARAVLPGARSRRRRRVSGASRASCEPDLLYRVARADALGGARKGSRPPPPRPRSGSSIGRARSRSRGRRAPLLLGRDSSRWGSRRGRESAGSPGGVYDLQLDGAVATLDEALAEARQLAES